MGKAVPQNVLFRSDGHGDNGCLTWADDGDQITAMCDGDWLSGAHRDEKMRQYHNHLYRVRGASNDFERVDIPAYPSLRSGEDGWDGASLDRCHEKCRRQIAHGKLHVEPDGNRDRIGMRTAKAPVHISPEPL